jgi:RNA polymerase sigma factor (sigma-70 family)
VRALKNSTSRGPGSKGWGGSSAVSSPTPDSDRWFSDDVQPHADELRAWLRGKFPALADPDNVVQEALTRVWRAHAAGPVATPRALLFTTARNLALDELRRRQIVAFEPLAEIGDLPVYEDVPTAADQAAANQELEILTKAIQSLPDRCRQVLTLRKIYGLPQKEIAAQLGIAEHTVEAQVAAGMKRCAVFLARHGLP